MLIITAYSMHRVGWRCDNSDTSYWNWDFDNIAGSRKISNVSYANEKLTINFDEIPWGGIMVIKFA